jgi:GNAT superfamily N-acetyltransferase
MTVIIRPAVHADAPVLTDLVISIGWFQWMKGQQPAVIERQVSHHLALCLQDNSHSVFVAETDQAEIVGYTSVHWNAYLIHPGPEGYVSELFIREAWRDQGLGCSLLETAAEEARSRGCARLLLINVQKRESYLRGFYRKNGWLEWDDAAVFVYPL